MALGVVLDRRLTWRKHAMAVARSCNYHSQAIRHIRHLLSTKLAVTLAYSLILSRLDYCNSVLLNGAPASSIQVLQRVQNNAARIVLQTPRRSHAQPLLCELHWLNGAPASSIQVLQRVQNNAARIVLQTTRRSHAQPLLCELHWLPIQHRIEYKVAVLTF